jgi:hypothetical protein
LIEVYQMVQQMDGVAGVHWKEKKETIPSNPHYSSFFDQMILSKIITRHQCQYCWNGRQQQGQPNFGKERGVLHQQIAAGTAYLQNSLSLKLGTQLLLEKILGDE